jgi:hypothetical protein
MAHAAATDAGSGGSGGSGGIGGHHYLYGVLQKALELSDEEQQDAAAQAAAAQAAAPQAAAADGGGRAAAWPALPAGVGGIRHWSDMQVWPKGSKATTASVVRLAQRACNGLCALDTFAAADRAAEERAAAGAGAGPAAAAAAAAAASAAAAGGGGTSGMAATLAAQWLARCKERGWLNKVLEWCQQQLVTLTGFGIEQVVVGSGLGVAAGGQAFLNQLSDQAGAVLKWQEEAKDREKEAADAALAAAAAAAGGGGGGGGGGAARAAAAAAAAGAGAGSPRSSPSNASPPPSSVPKEEPLTAVGTVEKVARLAAISGAVDDACKWLGPPHRRGGLDGPAAAALADLWRDFLVCCCSR